MGVDRPIPSRIDSGLELMLTGYGSQRDWRKGPSAGAIIVGGIFCFWEDLWLVSAKIPVARPFGGDGQKGELATRIEDGERG
jgi:hypothetical protein